MPVPDTVFSDMPELSDSALRALLALIRLSFRFDPDSGRGWGTPDRTFSRAAIEAQCGLSSEGTRNGLTELEQAGYAHVDRSGRTYEHELAMGVPSSRFTYVPLSLFEEAPGLSGTELRLVLAVLRATWGWTSDSGEGEAPEHRRWAQLPTSALSTLTGRSESAVKAAARGMQGGWIQRRRPSSGAYHYRFCTEALTTETGPEESPSTPHKLAVDRKRDAFFSMRVPNDLAPDRQQSGPPRRRNIEKSLETQAKHSSRNKGAERARENSPSPGGNSAVRGGKPPSGGSAGRSAQRAQPEKPRPKRGSHRRTEGDQQTEPEEIDLTGFSERKRELGQKLANVGVWPRRIPELLGRFTAERIEANFQLYRKRAPTVANDGGFLAAAIEKGYALPLSANSLSGSPAEGAIGDQDGENDPTLPEPGTKISETRRRELLEAGLATAEDFDRFADYDDPVRKQHFYDLD